MPYEPTVVVPDIYRACLASELVDGEASIISDYKGEAVRVLQPGETVIVLPTKDADTLVMFQAWIWMLKKMESASTPNGRSSNA